MEEKRRRGESEMRKRTGQAIRSRVGCVQQLEEKLEICGS